MQFKKFKMPDSRTDRSRSRWHRLISLLSLPLWPQKLSYEVNQWNIASWHSNSASANLFPPAWSSDLATITSWH